MDTMFYANMFALKNIKLHTSEQELKPENPLSKPALSDEKYAKILTLRQPIGMCSFMQAEIINKSMNS